MKTRKYYPNLPEGEMGLESLYAREMPEARTTKPHVVPIYQSSTFDFEGIHESAPVFGGEQKGHVYSRYGNPTVDAVADKITMMETFGLDIEAQSLYTTAGMSAIATLAIAVLKAGDTILTQGKLYGSTKELFFDILGNFGVKHKLVDLTNEAEVRQALEEDPSIRMIYFESMSNPLMAMVDMEVICGLAKEFGKITVVDNTFATPYLLQPFKYGLDYIIHSTTKYINGLGTAVGGVLIGRDIELMNTHIWRTMKLLGTQSDPFSAWVTNNGMKTMLLRVREQCANAVKIADFLEAHPQVDRVYYPGLPSHPHHDLAKKYLHNGYGAVVTFELSGDLESAKAFVNHLKFVRLAPTFGEVDTVLLHPATMSNISSPREVRLANGIQDGTLRLSAGIENVEDIIHDLKQAIEGSSAPVSETKAATV